MGNQTEEGGYHLGMIDTCIALRYHSMHSLAQPFVTFDDDTDSYDTNTLLNVSRRVWADPLSERL